MTEILMTRARLIAALALAIAIVARPDPAASDSASPQSVFDQFGLTQSDVWLVLPYESGVHDRVAKIKEKAEAVHVETTSRRDLRFEVQTDKRNIETSLGDLVATDTQWNRLIAARRRMNADDPDYSQVTNMYNAVVDRRNAISQQVNDEEDAEAAAEARLGQVPDSRAEYVNLVMDVAAQAESVAKSYAALSQNPQLAQAIAAANATASPPVKLGPSQTFSDDLNFLRKTVKEVVDSPIPVRRDSDELYVQPVINGSVTVEMVWDSGADDVVLSADTARQLGMHFTDKDPTDETGTAGSTIIKVHEATLDSIRLGGFTVHNVPCVVLPDNPGGGPVDNLLGDTFQTHFVSRMDQRTQQLQLTPADSSVLVGAIPHELGAAR